MAPTAAPAADAWVHGVDLSHWQTPGLKLPAEIRFAWIKSSQGDEITDRAMRAHHADLGRRGIARGAYHFYECNDTPAGNAGRFLAATAGLAWELPHALDYEHASGTYGSSRANAAKLLEFLRLVEKGTGRVPVIYTGTSWWSPMVAADEAFARYPIWLARYPAPNDGTPPAWGRTTPAPRPWSTFDVWQFSDSSGRLDRNAATPAAYARLIGKPAHPTPPTEFLNMDEKTFDAKLEAHRRSVAADVEAILDARGLDEIPAKLRDGKGNLPLRIRNEVARQGPRTRETTIAVRAIARGVRALLALTVKAGRPGSLADLASDSTTASKALDAVVDGDPATDLTTEEA